ncbi:hypothetical protein [Escherichia coli]|uniref:hypothetical protein n=1 Tax=Escherichia coli TaxID=562 RepID=UPI0018E0F3E1|nr:hypothetical protein [Escherichia coli]
MEWLSEIRKLRKNVPVGIQVARRLLERTGGDVDEAIKLFHIDQINIIADKKKGQHQRTGEVFFGHKFYISRPIPTICEQT